jgi:hypothetical protein
MNALRSNDDGEFERQWARLPTKGTVDFDFLSRYSGAVANVCMRRIHGARYLDAAEQDQLAKAVLADRRFFGSRIDAGALILLLDQLNAPGTVRETVIQSSEDFMLALLVLTVVSIELWPKSRDNKRVERNFKRAAGIEIGKRFA